MLIVDGNDIKISYGDTLNITFVLSGYELQLGDKVVFSVKQKLSDTETLITKEYSELIGTEIPITIDSEEMKKLPIGVNFYDLVVVKSETQTTLNLPAKIIIERVVHNE